MIVLSESDRARISDPRKRERYGESYEVSFTDIKGNKHKTFYFSTSKQAGTKIEKIVRAKYHVDGAIKVRYQ